jgi:hypothetical protein
MNLQRSKIETAHSACFGYGRNSVWELFLPFE